MAVGARAAQNGLEDLVLLGHGGDGLAHLELAQAFGDVQPAVLQEHLLRDGLIKALKVLHADGREHLFPFRRSGRNVGAHA